VRGTICINEQLPFLCSSGSGPTTSGRGSLVTSGWTEALDQRPHSAAWPSCRPPHLRVSGELLGRSPCSAASHMRQYKRKLISLINTLAMTNESTHVPKRCSHLGGIQVRPTHTSRRRRTPPPRKVWSGSPLITRPLVDKKERDFSPRRKGISTNVLTSTTIEPTHKI